MNYFTARSKYLTINAILLFIITAIIELILHEGGHFVAALSLGQQATLYHNYVSYDNETGLLNQRIFFAAAGPVVSLLTGLICYFSQRIKSIGAYTRLFLWYLAAAGYAGFFGYLMIAPFFTYGDTGFVLTALNVPMVIIFIIAIAGIAMLYLVMNLLAKHLVALMPDAIAGDMNERQQWIRALIVFPLLFGTPVVTLLNLPVPTFLSLLAPICTPFALLYPYGYYIKGKPGFIHSNGDSLSARTPIILFVLLIAIVALNRLLVYGITLR